MNIIKFQGGLGNQMFQYALYRKMELAGIAVNADLSFFKRGNVAARRDYELDQFHIRLINCSKWGKKRKDNFFTRQKLRRTGYSDLLYIENGVSDYDSRVLELRNAYLDGYWQTELYFRDVRDELLRDYSFPKSVTEEEADILAQIRECHSVSVHVRRGDYLDNMEKYGNICTEQYYLSAMQYLQADIPDVSFFVFTDDKEWAKSYFKTLPHVRVVDLGGAVSAIHDMKLMSACKHNIIANSSFSWWAAWLNQNAGKKVIAPLIWKNGEILSDIVCKGWITVSGK